MRNVSTSDHLGLLDSAWAISPAVSSPVADGHHYTINGRSTVKFLMQLEGEVKAGLSHCPINVFQFYL
jgi:hypothetical protein